MIPVDFGRRQAVVRSGRASVRVSWRTVAAVGTMLAVAALVAVWAVGSGTYPVSPTEVMRVLLGTNTSFDRTVVLQWRMPRMLMALLAGAALGISGAIFQALTQNSLGSPDIIGINTGAYTGALVALAAAGGGYYRVAAGALVGGLATAAIVYALSYRNGLLGYRLIVVGIAVGAVLSSVNQWIVVRLDFHTALTASVWQQGTLNGLGWTQVLPMAACLGVVVAVLATMGPALSVLQMGDAVAGGLGLRPERLRFGYLVGGVALVAVACAAAGPISFIALAAPQIARRCTAGAGISLAPAAAMGAVLLLVSDVVAQRVLPGGQLPVGAVTATLGGGYLVYLLVAQSRKGPR
ncbi:FecCD family ABC transporter permease [Mycolicibacterium anyangense]|nr:iron chelate uptake ABC transporter family permease subunit [Mycolicibacterium anyangense]